MMSKKRNEFLIPFGVKPNNLENFVHIGMLNPDKDKGLSCGLVCVECGQPLVARFPRTNPEFKPHFAHYMDSECTISKESLVHKMAKSIIAEEKAVMFPQLDVSYRGRTGTVFSERELQFEKVELEKRYDIDSDLSFIVPDIVTTDVEGTEVFIEIVNTHAVDEDKLAKIEELGKLTIEIDVSNVPDVFDRELLRDLVITSVDNKRWLYHPHVEGMYNMMKLSITEAEESQSEYEQDAHYVLEYQTGADYADPIDSRLDTIEYYQENYGDWWNQIDRELEEHSKYTYLGVDRKNPNIYHRFGHYALKCHYKIWQAYIFEEFILKAEDVVIMNIVKDLKMFLRKDIEWDLSYLGDIPMGLRTGVYDLTESVHMYLEHLADIGYLDLNGQYRHKYFASYSVNEDFIYDRV